jgi:hypothetical protein
MKVPDINIPKSIDDLPELPAGAWYAIFIVAALLIACLTVWCLTRAASWLCCCCCSSAKVESSSPTKSSSDGWFSRCRRNRRRNKLDEIAKKNEMYASLRVGRGRSSSFSKV